MTTSSCVTGFDELARWSGQACAQWPARTLAEKQEWVQNYFQAHNMHANNTAVSALIAQMDLRCGVRPAGSLADGLENGFSDQGSSGDNQNQSTEAERILTNQSFGRTLGGVFHEISNTIVGVTNSANKTNYGYAANNGIGGYPGGGYSPQGGVAGGFSAPGIGYGSGAISWTPILIGGVIVIGFVAFIMSNAKKS